MRFISTLAAAALFVSPLFAQAQTAGIPPFTCKVSTAHASTSLKPLSSTETYMQSAAFEGLTIETYQNEDGVSYAVTVSREKTVLAQADIVMYADTSLKLNIGREMVTVHCMTPASASPTGQAPTNP